MMLVQMLRNAFFSDIIEGLGNPLPETEIRINAETTERIVPKKYQSEVMALRNYVGEVNFQPGSVLTLKLSELLTIIPKERKRCDAYKGLVQYLADEQGIILNITSRKNKKV